MVQTRGIGASTITISANGRSVVAMFVDECDFTMGCDEEHDYQPPCQNNIVEASKVVWKALGVPHDQWGELEITWSPNALYCVQVDSCLCFYVVNFYFH